MGKFALSGPPRRSLRKHRLKRRLRKRPIRGRRRWPRGRLALCAASKPASTVSDPEVVRSTEILPASTVITVALVHLSSPQCQRSAQCPLRTRRSPEQRPSRRRCRCFPQPQLVSCRVATGGRLAAIGFWADEVVASAPQGEYPWQGHRSTEVDCWYMVGVDFLVLVSSSAGIYLIFPPTSHRRPRRSVNRISGRHEIVLKRSRNR